MNLYGKLAMAAAAVVVAAFVGINLFALGGPGGPTPPPTASPAPTSQATPIVLNTAAQLGPGDFVAGAPFLLRVTGSIPAGWQGNVGGPYLVDLHPTAGQSGGIALAVFSKVAVDPCQYAKGFKDVTGDTVDDLVAALQAVPGITVSSPKAVTFKGYAGKSVTITSPAIPSSCTLGPQGYTIWQLPLGGEFSLDSRDREQIWILDVGGTRLAVISQDGSMTAAQKAEAQAVLDSVVIAPGS
jgi:hypothetical protein